jgi:hypothetical protein
MRSHDAEEGTVRDTVKKMQRMGAALGRLGPRRDSVINAGASCTNSVGTAVSLRLGWATFWPSMAWVIVELVRHAA